MNVYVPGEARAGDLSYVQSYIITVWRKFFVEGSFGPVHKLHEVHELGVSKQFEALDMPERGDHDMPVIVRIEVEHRE